VLDIYANLAQSSNDDAAGAPAVAPPSHSLVELVSAGYQRIVLDFTPFKISHLPYLSFDNKLALHSPSSSTSSTTPSRQSSQPRNDSPSRPAASATDSPEQRLALSDELELEPDTASQSTVDDMASLSPPLVCTQFAIVVSGNDGLHAYRQLPIDTEGEWDSTQIEQYFGTTRSISSPTAAHRAGAFAPPPSFSPSGTPLELRIAHGAFEEIPIASVFPEIDGARTGSAAGDGSLSDTDDDHNDDHNDDDEVDQDRHHIDSEYAGVSTDAPTTQDEAHAATTATLATTESEATAASGARRSSISLATLPPSFAANSGEHSDRTGVLIEPLLPCSLLAALIEQDPSVPNNLLRSIPTRSTAAAAAAAAAAAHSFRFLPLQVPIHWDIRSIGSLRVSVFACQDGSLHLFVADTLAGTVHKKVTWLDAPLSSATLFSPQYHLKPPLLVDIPLDHTYKSAMFYSTFSVRELLFSLSRVLTIHWCGTRQNKIHEITQP